jgi:transposase-like protein
MFKQIRTLMSEDIRLEGSSVEMDEAYLGGQDKFRHAGKRKGGGGRSLNGKSAVFGMVERQGRVVARVVPDIKADTLMPIVAAKVLPSSMVFTDDFPVYDRVGKMGYTHNRINHSARVYVDGNVHTQTIEGFWSLLKRGIGGVYHSVGAEYLQTYCNEYAYRYSHRKDPKPMFVGLLERVVELAN